MKDFSIALRESSRKIVIHETCNLSDDSILDALHESDLLFFDDCLYSQYVFIKRNIETLLQKKIACVLGFSTKIFRPMYSNPIYRAICAESHDKIHNGDMTALANYMSLSEIRELIELSDVFIACHGQQHLQLEKLSGNKIQRSQEFLRDVTSATNDLKSFRIETDIFVYPYAYDDFIFRDKSLQRLGYHYFFAGKDSQRIDINTLVNY